jgi:hypothetical protein
MNLDGNALTGDMSVPPTGGWQTWQNVTSPTFTLPAGTHVLTFNTVSGGQNLNYFSIASVGTLLTRVFEQRENNAAVPVEWDYGYYKGDCGAQWAITGLSTDLNGGLAHALLCWSGGNAGEFTGSAVTTVSPVWGGTTANMLYSRMGDWDYGYYKAECGLNEYVSGVSQAPGSGAVHGIRCASASMTSNGTANCETRLVTQSDGFTGTDWDYGYHKGQCAANKVVVGVSANASDGQPHRILCCSQ